MATDSAHRSVPPVATRLAASLVLASLALGTGAARAQTQAATPPPVLGPSTDIDQGLPWLAELLESIGPSVDTRLPETRRAATERLADMVERGQARQALPEIEAAIPAGEGRVNVQMLFLKARALARLDRRDEAKDLYRDMTTRFPELSGPWNNLAALEAADGRLGPARSALEMAVRTRPDDALARENLGDLYIMLAAQSYQESLRLAPSSRHDARRKLDGIPALLQPSAPPAGAPGP